MSMSPAMLTALSSRNPLLVFLLRIELPGRTIRLVDGSGFVIWGAEVFRGEDAEFGRIAGFGDFTEGEGTEAPRQLVQLLPTGNAALAALTAPEAQGSPVSIYAAVIDPQTGQIIGEPDARFVGELDDAGFNPAQNASLLELEVASIWERLFDDNEGHRWNDAFWTSIYGAGAHAFEHVANAEDQNYWGYLGPTKGTGGSYGGGNGSIGGGGGRVVQQEV